MDLGGRAAEQVDHRGDLGGLGDAAPVEVDLVGRDLGDDVADAVERGVAEQRVGVHLQRPLADDRAVGLVLEVGVDARRVDEPAQRGHVGLLHREDDVVVERLAVALDQQAVGGEAGAADPEAGGADGVDEVVEQVAVEALVVGDGVQVALEGRDHPAALGPAEAAHRRAVAEQPRRLVLHGQGVEQVGPAHGARLHQRLAAPARGCCRGAARSRRRRRCAGSG